MSFVYEFFGDVCDELLFGLKRRFGPRCEAKPCRNTKHVRIYSHIRLLVDHRCDHIGRFAPYTGKLHQFIYGHRHLSVKRIHQHLAEPDQVFGFIVGVRYAAGEREKLIESSLCEGIRSRLAGGQCRRGHVDPLIGTLGR